MQDTEVEDSDFGVKDAHRSEEAVGKIFQPRCEVGLDGGVVVFAVDQLENVIVCLAVGGIV